MGFVIDSTCDKDRGYSVPGILCSHPRSLPSANFKVLIFARRLLHRKIKVQAPVPGKPISANRRLNPLNPGIKFILRLVSVPESTISAIQRIN